MSELENVRFGGTCSYPGCIEPAGHVGIHPGEGKKRVSIPKHETEAGIRLRVTELEAENARLQARVRSVEQARALAPLVRRWVEALLGRCNRFEALAERRKEAEAHLKTARWVLEMDDPRLLKALQTIERLIAERDRYKALAEVRREAIIESREIHHAFHTGISYIKDAPAERCGFHPCKALTAAITMKPEEAKEKEGQAT